MSHYISGIITSFTYEGDLPNVALVGNYHFIPFKQPLSPKDQDPTIEPYREMTEKVRKTLKDLSFKGKCAYIETDYFGGAGSQLAEAWENGDRILGPYISFDGNESWEYPKEVKEVYRAINRCLSIIGVFKDEGKDEFDSIRLGWYRSNDDFLEEIEGKR